MEKKTFEDRYADEMLSDNSREESCKQCKNCSFHNDGTAWSNHYTKSCCMIYQYPSCKPMRVINNTGICEYYNE